MDDWKDVIFAHIIYPQGKKEIKKSGASVRSAVKNVLDQSRLNYVHFETKNK